ncbi:MAG: methyltransferase domain-containing protein [bacterium]
MSQTVKTWTEWLKKSRFSYMTEEQKEQTLRWLLIVKDKVLANAKIKPTDIVIDIGTGTGLLAFGAMETVKDTGKIIAMDVSEDCVEECLKIAKECDINLETLVSDIYNIKLNDNFVDVAVMRSVLVHVPDKQKSFAEIYRILKPQGHLSFFEPVVSSNTKYYELISHNIKNYDKFKEVELQIMNDQESPLTNFTAETLLAHMEEAGFKNINLETAEEKSIYTVKAEMVEPWFNTPTSPGNPSLKDKLSKYFNDNEVNEFIENIKQDLDGKEITVKMVSVYGYAEK